MWSTDKQERDVQDWGVTSPALHHSEKEPIAMNSTTNRTHSENEQYEYYPLDTNAGYALLAEDHEIVVNPQTGQVTLVNWERRHFVTDCLFTVQECAVLMALLDAWSSYMPTDQLLRELRKQAGPTHEQQEPSGQDVPLTRLRTVFARCQERLHHLGLDIIPVGEQSLLLVRFQEPNREEQADAHEDQCDPSARPTAREEGD